jgi:hypothetical protein
LHFNSEKCKIIHIAHDVETVYYLADHGQMKKLNETECERNLGVLTTMNLKPSLQCTKSAEKATSILRMIKRNSRKLTWTNSESSIGHTYVLIWNTVFKLGTHIFVKTLIV